MLILVNARRMSDKTFSAPATSFYKIEQTVSERIHNDLGKAAFYFRTKVAEQEGAGNTDGLKFDMMAALTMTAFFIEASINYIGKDKIADWKERQPGNKKLREVTAALGISPDLSSRPWSVVKRLKDFRDTLAHGKPQNLKAAKKIEGPVGMKIDHQLLQSDWMGELNVQSVIECYEDANAISVEMFAAAGIKAQDAVSHESVCIRYEGPPIQGTGMPQD
jgi:hypothetical protein